MYAPQVSAIDMDCPVHGRVKAVYRVECCWWECPRMVDCGTVVTREDRLLTQPTVGSS